MAYLARRSLVDCDGMFNMLLGAAVQNAEGVAPC
jgi:hypothetical protein